ncbi:MAG: hypothetical protein AAFV45_13865 [Pseudomonadota bacterium]
MTATTRGNRLGLGVLSWHGYETLEASLKTYPASGFLDLFDERVIFFPEITDQGCVLAARFGFEAKGQPQNKGIMDGFRGLANAMQSDTVVMVENDCPLIESCEEAAKQIATAQHLIENGSAQVVRLRSRRDPGEAFDTADKYMRLYPPTTAHGIDQLKAGVLRRLRPGKARKLIGTSVYVEAEPAQKFPGTITDAGSGFYLAPTDAITWTNQSIMIDRRFFLDNIIARAENVTGRRTVNGFKNLEIELNDHWWRSRPWTVAIAPGLFTHRRLGTRGY